MPPTLDLNAPRDATFTPSATELIVLLICFTVVAWAAASL